MDDNLSLFLVLIPALPLAAAVICAVLGPRLLGGFCHVPVIAAVVGSFICSLLLLVELRHAQREYVTAAATAEDHGGYEHTVTLWTWAAVERAYDHRGQSPTSPSARGWHDFQVDVTLRADSLTVMMLTMVTFIASLIVIYSSGYMHGDPGYWRFFAYLGLFVFSMTMLVSVSNFVLLYVFWEAVGLCSYLLIGFWYQKPEAAAAGKKAFLVNRVGDLGFALALLMIWSTYGTLNFHDAARDSHDANSQVAAAPAASAGGAKTEFTQGVLGKQRIEKNDYVGGKVGLAICLLLLIGACGKSAQFPLHVWLPDAMEGPTPVSALIHAATMVTAGVYMIARCTPLFMVSPQAQLVVACIGGFTALLAALIALTQFDLKRVLAYSTISQLGFMFLGLGVGTFAGITAGMFHLFTHAFFKALLFLGAGSVMHAMGNVIDMRSFGGLRKLMPVTHATFFIGCLALAGIPPMSGFWSKDGIMASVEEKAHSLTHSEVHSAPNRDHTDSHPTTALATGESRSALVYRLLYYVAMLTAFLTSFYTFRALYLTFYGPQQIPHEAGRHAHESPPVMCWPLVILALGAALAGICFDRTFSRSQPMHFFAEFLALTPSLHGGAVAATRTPYAFHGAVAAVSITVAVGGWLLATYFYLRDLREIRWLRSFMDMEQLAWLDSANVSRWRQQPAIAGVQRLANRVGLGWLTGLIGHALLLLLLVLASPLLLGKFISPYRLSSQKFYLDEVYHYTIVLPLRGLAQVCYALDRGVIDGLVNLIGWIPPAVGALMRSLQMGLFQFYALAMFLGVLVLIATKLIWGTG